MSNDNEDKKLNEHDELNVSGGRNEKVPEEHNPGPMGPPPPTPHGHHHHPHGPHHHHKWFGHPSEKFSQENPSAPAQPVLSETPEPGETKS